MSQEKSLPVEKAGQQIITAMALHHSMVVNGLLASMPVREIPPKRGGEAKGFEKLVIEQKRSVTELVWIMNRSVTL
jgi:hypothetical protein